MAYPPQLLSNDALGEIRAALHDIKARGGPATLSAAAVALANVYDPSIGITIDFRAERELGLPLVIVRWGGKNDAYPDWYARLSSRERDVVRRIALGESNKEIAQALGIASSTIKDHVHNILAKSGLPSRAVPMSFHR